MLFVSVHCMDETDREILIPLHCVTKVEINLDGKDSIYVDGRCYLPRIEDNFYMSIKDIKEHRLSFLDEFARGE